MKKGLIALILAALLLLPRNVYRITGTVVALDHGADVVTVEDESGHLWEFTECEDWMIGDFCEMTMIDTGLPWYRYDDTITRTIYTGYAGNGLQ